MMKIAIIGTRGIPNHYGGFEQFAEYLSQLFVKAGHSVYVYNSHNHPFREPVWNGVNIIHQYDPEQHVGTLGQFIYDLNCIRDLKRHSFDIVLQLGYTSSSIWGMLLPKKAKIVTNMDGLEWKRTKYNAWVKRFLRVAERLAISSSDVLIADSIGIQKYLQEEFQKSSVFIPYGAEVVTDFDNNHLAPYGVKPYHYDMLIARIEPENNIEAILKGFTATNVQRDFLVIGNICSKFGRYISTKYNDKRIKYLGGIYNIKVLDSLRYYSNLYFHGHTVGGTNPSLLEAMASGALICAHRNIFNYSILEEDAFYFQNDQDVSQVLSQVRKEQEGEFAVKNNYQKIKDKYSWQKIFLQYESVFEEILN